MRKPLSHKLLLCAIICFVGSTSVFCQLSTTSFQEAKRAKTAKFYYVYDEVYGLTQTTQSGEVTGVLVDLMKEFESYLRSKEGIVVSSEYIFESDFEVFLKNVRLGRGGIFGLSNISINEERKKEYAFSPPYLENVSMLLTNSMVPTLEDISEISARFEGMTAYTLSHSTYHQRLLEIKKNHFPSMQIVEMSSIPPIMEQLKTGSKAFAVLDLNVYIEVLRKKLPIKRHSVGDQKGDKFGIIMPKGSDWEQPMRDFLTEFYGSSEYGRIITKNLGSSALMLLNSFN